MPAKPAWLLKIPDIISVLEQFDAPVVDRATCERLFGVRRRRAVSLLQRFGGYQAGRTYLVDRDELLTQLRVIAGGSAFGSERQRKKRLTASLDELHQARKAMQVRIPVADSRTSPCLPDVPGLSVSPGVLSIAYSTVEELLTRLYSIARVAADDYDGFCFAVDPHRYPAGADSQPVHGRTLSLSTTPESPVISGPTPTTRTENQWAV